MNEMETMVNVLAPDAFFRDSDALSADDKLAMLELTNRFEWCFDARRLDVLATLLTEDVVIDHLFGMANNKTEAIAMLRDVVPFRGIRHQATNATVFTNDKDEPCVLSYLMVVQTHDDDNKVTNQLPRVLAHALVTDRMRKDGNRWLIAGRTFEQMILTRDYVPTEDGWRKLQQTATERAAEKALTSKAPK
jgi:hypothetical protein